MSQRRRKYTKYVRENSEERTDDRRRQKRKNKSEKNTPDSRLPKEPNQEGREAERQRQQASHWTGGQLIFIPSAGSRNLRILLELHLAFASLTMSSLAASRADGFYHPPDYDASKGSLKKFTGAKGKNQYEQKGKLNNVSRVN